MMDDPKIKAQYSCLGVGLLTVIIACVGITLVWPAIKAAAVADRQQPKRSELAQARARWEAHPFSSYRLLLQFHLRDGSVCERVFEVAEPAQTKPLSDTCAGISAFSFGDTSSVMGFLGSRTSVPGLFDYIEAEIGRVGQCGIDGCACSGATTIDALYDTDLGYPTEIKIWFVEDWTTKGVCLGHSAVAIILPSPITVSVHPI
jgi:hypothetical protein